MAEDTTSKTHIAVLLRTQKQIAILSKVMGTYIYELVATWVDREWEKAKKAGLVTDAMLQTQDTPSTTKKTRAVDVALVN